jgi:hypothetical protein
MAIIFGHICRFELLAIPFSKIILISGYILNVRMRVSQSVPQGFSMTIRQVMRSECCCFC